MVVNIKKITSAINKINDLASSEARAKPGFMFKLSNTDGDGVLQVCYCDGYKAFVEYMPVEIEDTDKLDTEIVVEFEPMIRAIQNCQPSGIIKCTEVKFNFLENDIMRISATQEMDNCDAEGNVIDTRTLGIKQMDLKWTLPGASMKASILSRMKYDTIFEAEATTDEYDKAELIDILSRTATEKGKSIYLSNKTQAAFVANQAHLTIVPVSQFEALSDEELDEIRGELSESNSYSEENFKAAVADRVNRIHHSVVIRQEVAKAIISILGKCDSDKVALHRKDGKYCCLNIDTEEDDTFEKVGIWFEMVPANKAHVGAVERYTNLEFGTYQLMFIRELLVNSIKSACDNAKDSRSTFRFEPTQIDGAVTETDLIIDGAGSNDEFRINMDAIVDSVGNLTEQTFTVNLKLIGEMLNQLKTPYVAMDFEVNANDSNSKCLRISEINTEKLSENYSKLRAETKAMCESQGIEFKPDETPTPVGLKIKNRVEYLETKQFAMLAK